MNADREELRHPRAVAALRVAIYATAALVLLVMVVVALGFLGALAVTGGILAAVGQGGLLSVGGVALVGLLLVAATVGGVLVGARHLDRRIVDADRVPDPLEEAKERYVRDDIDEFELEERLERAMGEDESEREPARRTRSREPER